MSERDLFGEDIKAEPVRVTPSGRKRKPTKPNGYAYRPGTGPAGETCGTCEHKVRKQMGGTFLKCGLAHHKWTGGPGSDILARSPACSGWKARLDR